MGLPASAISSASSVRVLPPFTVLLLIVISDAKAVAVAALPVQLPEEPLTLPVISPVTLPVKLAVTVPAEKLPLASRFTSLSAVFAEAAFDI